MTGPHSATPTVSPLSLLSYDKNLQNRAETATLPKIYSLQDIMTVAIQLLEESTVSTVSTGQTKTQNQLNLTGLFLNQSQAYISFSQKEASVLPVQTVGQPPYGPVKGGPSAQVCIKTGYIHNDDYYVVKVAAGGGKYIIESNSGPESHSYGNSGFLLVHRQTDLQLDSILYDEGILTEMRTAAASCLVSAVMMKERLYKGTVCDDSSDFCIGLIGAGIQAVWQLRFLNKILPSHLPRRVLIKSRSKESVQKLKDQMGCSDYSDDRKWDIIVYDNQSSNKDSESDSNSINFSQCDLIHTLTTSKSPVLTLEDVGGSERFSDNSNGKTSKSLHITAVGCDTPGKQELSLDLVKAADRLVTDSITQTKERGEFQHVMKDSVGPELTKIEEIGQVLLNLSQESKSKKAQLTIFDTSGIAVQDVSIAKAVVQTLSRK